MSVDVEIYMNNLIKFFRSNPEELLNLIPQNKENEFYEKIRNAAVENFENGEEITLTQKQMINICREINGQNIQVELEISNAIVKTKFGSYSLN